MSKVSNPFFMHSPIYLHCSSSTCEQTSSSF